jgi:L-iditol 2-dehydrogenase
VQFFAPTEPGVNLSVPVNEFWRNGITILPSYGAASLDLTTAIDLIRSRRVHVKEMITHRLSLAEAGKGFQLVASAGESLKAIIEPW